MNLKPRFEKAKTILFEELEEVQEIIFIQKGYVDIGYEINKQKRYVLRLQPTFEIGGMQCSFDERMMFVFMCKTDC